MKLFRCGDVVPGCDASFRAAEEETLLADVARHARGDHGVEPDEDLVAAVRRAVVVEPDR